MFKDTYKNKKVFITGHTGFKGSWLSLWLLELGAEVIGYALSSDMQHSHWNELNLPVNDICGDIRDLEKLTYRIKQTKPDIVFHLAAQPLVRHSYKDPAETWSTNVMGTVNILEACKSCESVRAVVIITTDKVYENNEWVWGYRETDRLGGFDPYSSSKAAAELVVDSYRRSFFSNSFGLLLASARAGNVIGGGDWSADRLIPDIVKSFSNNKPIVIRSPYATRPWQHVLDCLSGYLLLGQQLLSGQTETASAWNFGPQQKDNRRVIEILNLLENYFPGIVREINQDVHGLHEASALYLDSSKSRNILQWEPIWDLEQTVEATGEWYSKWLQNGIVSSTGQLKSYLKDACNKKVIWAQ